MGSKLPLLAKKVRGRASLILGLAIVVFAGRASADSKAADLAKQGADAFGAGKYDEAAVFLQKSYEAEPQTQTLFALAQAERLGGHCPAAVVHYKKLLEQLTDLETAQLVQGNVALCEKTESVGAKPPPKPDAPPTQPAKPAVVVASHTDALAIALFATGTLGLGVSTGLYVASNASRDDAAHARTLADNSKFNDRASLERGLSYVTAGAGIGVIGYAVYRWVRGGGERSTPTVSIAPSTTSTTVSVIGRW